MNQKLTIGIIGLDPGWQIILDQLGVSYESMPTLTALNTVDYGLLIVNRKVLSIEARLIRHYLITGGAVIDTGPYLVNLFGRETKRRQLHRIFPQEDTPFADINLCDIPGPVTMRKSAPFLSGLIDIQAVKSGIAAFIGLPMTKLMRDYRSVRKQFYTPFSKPANEVVARVSKGEILQIVKRLIRFLFWERNLPFVYKWYFPEQAPSIFAFRIDSDGGSREQIDTIYQAAKDHDVGISWFLDVKSHVDWLQAFAEMNQRQEIAVHCFEHRAFAARQEMKVDIDHARRTLANAGLKTNGYAGPFGRWSPTLNEVIDDIGFRYASEFALAYDTLPFFPQLDGRFADALQIPIHPICTGSFRRTSATDAEVRYYFQWLAQRKIRLGEAIVLYDHPTTARMNVLRDIFADMQALEIPRLTFNEINNWWRKRHDLQFSAAVDQQRLIFNKQTGSDGVALRIERRDKTAAFASAGQECTVACLKWQPTEEADALPLEALKQLRRPTLKLIHYSLLDSWWRYKS